METNNDIWRLSSATGHNNRTSWDLGNQSSLASIGSIYLYLSHNTEILLLILKGNGF